jgi:hypothetical protein
MYKSERLVVRLDKVERASVERLAQFESLPPSTLARYLLLREAEKRGLWPLPDRAREVADERKK